MTVTLKEARLSAGLLNEKAGIVVKTEADERQRCDVRESKDKSFDARQSKHWLLKACETPNKYSLQNNLNRTLKDKNM